MQLQARRTAMRVTSNEPQSVAWSVARFALVPLIAVAALGSSQAAAMSPGTRAPAMQGGPSAVITVDNQGDPIAGRKLFLENNCYICHGGRGGGGMCPSLRANKPDQNDVFNAVTNGTPVGMPSFAALLSVPDIQDLFAYIDSLRSNNEPTFTHWWEANPTQ
jgi:mono/diheme cytochrome c family protein